jgi:uncharacterized protein YfaQ (DUF2300 family)
MVQSTRCDCDAPRGVYRAGCPQCERREKKVLRARERRNGVNAAGTTLDAMTATALLQGWHFVNDDLVEFTSAWEQLTGRQQSMVFPAVADRLAHRVRTLTGILAVILRDPHLVAEGETAADCWTRQASGQPRGH